MAEQPQKRTKRSTSSMSRASPRATRHRLDVEGELGIVPERAAAVDAELTQVEQHAVIEMALIDVVADLPLVSAEMMYELFASSTKRWATRSIGVKSGFRPLRPSCGK